MFILNDRVDLAVAADADGVHLGQDDLDINEARPRLPPEMLVGISTHDGDQLLSACDAGADYLGVGPVMRSSTKSFDEFAGLQFVEVASAKADRPWFAIGGIDAGNVAAVTAVGATRVAVSSAVIRHEDPAAAAAELRRLLQPSASLLKIHKDHSLADSTEA